MKMNELYDKEHCAITEEHLYEMARIQQANSGLPYIMFASTKEVVDSRHGPRVKISNIPNTFSNSDNFVVKIDKNPTVVAGKCKYKDSELHDIFDWVKLNYDTLMKYWRNEYKNDALFYEDLKKI